MSNSLFVDYIQLSPNYNPRGDHKIRKITIHHVAGIASVESLGSGFASESRNASANYGIGSDGRIGMFVEEKNRAWTSSSADNDYQAITIEVSNDVYGGNWHVSDYVLSRLIDLCVDICKRNGIERLNYTGDASGNLTMHKWFAPTDCPGEYLERKFPYIADEVNKRLEEGKPMTAEEKKEFEALKEEVAKLRDQVGVKWAYIDGNMPEWMRATVKKLADRGYLKGSNNSFEISYQLARILVILDRAGVFEKEQEGTK